jgi:hypothetical protein
MELLRRMIYGDVEILEWGKPLNPNKFIQIVKAL